jgi:hypothetical protein
MALVETEYTSSDTHSNYDANPRESVFGGDTDLWGASEITLSQLQDPAFKIKFDANVGAGLLRADKVKVEVFFVASAQGTQNALIYDEHAVSTTYAPGDIVWAIADDGTAHIYTAAGTGDSGSKAPTFPSFSGQSVTDGYITWTESGVYLPKSLPIYHESELAAGSIGRDSNGNLLFILVGRNGLIRTSSDGDIWTDQDSGVAENLRGVAAGPNGFIAVGDNGVVVSSADGVTWAREASITNETLLSVDFSREQGTFTAVGVGGIVANRSVDEIWAKTR